MAEPAESTVLVVEDEDDLRELYAAFLRERYDVRTAPDGAAALEAVDGDVDVVVLDRRMPNMTGDEVLPKLRARDGEFKVAMLTAVEPEADIVEMPFDDYRTKPVGADELTGMVEVLLHRRHYDERSQEFFSLASKKAALEAAGNVDTEEYETLRTQLETVRADIDETLDHVGAKAAFSDI